MSETNEKPGFFKKASKWVKDAYEEERQRKADAAAAEKAFYEEAATKYGRLIASEIFDNRRIELFDGGYVRVGGAYNRKGGPTPREENSILDSRDYVIAYDTPFEKLRAIKASTQIQDKSAGGRAVASKASLGLSELASNEKRILFLNISTDQETYSFKDKAGMRRSADQVPMRLELAGQGILDALAAAGGSAPTPAPAPDAQASVADELRELAALHRDGVLTDEEFTSAKAKLLGAS